VVERDGTADYFVEMMPTLHNYITVDETAFLADPNRLLAVCSIIKRVLLDDKEADEDAQSHAAKLIEVLILQFRQNIQSVIPNLLQLAMERLNRPIKTSELRTMCLQASDVLEIN
jgi:5-methylcytosine-specific restriction endonuclease McrBC regulatory subunit McrC